MIDANDRFAINDLYADYASALDGQRYEEWIDLFTDETRYMVQPRENYEAGLPLATIRLESKAMLRDRIYGVNETLYHAPYYQRHIIGPLRLKAEPSDILSTGRYLDEVVKEDAQYLFRSKLCIFDTELIPNSLIYPI